jgi:hypothetical protein
MTVILERSEGSQLYWLGLHFYDGSTNLKGEILRFAVSTTLPINSID